MQGEPLNKPFSVVCPMCKTRQTAFIKLSTGFVQISAKEKVGYNLQEGTPYILCVNRWGCQHLIVGDELQEIINVVKYPSDMRKLLKITNY